MNVLDNSSSVFFSSIALSFLSDDIYGVISFGDKNHSSWKRPKWPTKPKAGSGHRTERDYAIKRSQNNGGNAGKTDWLPKNPKAWWNKFSS